MKMLKKIFLLAAALTVMAGAQAQMKGDQAFGAGLVVGSGDLDNVGIGIKYQYNVTAPIRIEPTLNVFFKKNFVSALDIMANFQYMLPVADNFNLYPLVGMGVQRVRVYASETSDRKDWTTHSFQFNIGCGAEYWFVPSLAGVFEYKYKLSEYDFANFYFGISYKF